MVLLRGADCEESSCADEMPHACSPPSSTLKILEISMPDIRYVCLSDTHFGADNSLLTNIRPNSITVDPLRPSPVLESFVACLTEIISKNESNVPPTLVLNGDILELALTTDNNAAMAFERFMELIVPKS